ncbi:MAG: IS66 family transposase [Haliscomenobacter sp.]|nr:IS66 family transposase [Haliscomenobacter sp.]
MLLAYILVSKYADHLPLYRQLMMFKRSGIDINDVTLNGWVKQVIALLQILYERIRSSMLGSNYLMADESTIRVLDQDKKGATHLGYYWAYRDPVEGSVLFVYEKGRAGKYVRDHLSTFSGYLQTDAYTAYDSMPKANEGVTMVGCWAHVRRKFADALVVEQEQASLLCRANPAPVCDRTLLPYRRPECRCPAGRAGSG